MSTDEAIDPFVVEADDNPGQAYADTAICASSSTPIKARQTLRKKLRVTATFLEPEPERGQPTAP